MKKLMLLALVLALMTTLSGCYVIGDALGGARTISRRTLDGNNILANYEWYHSTFTEVLSKVAMYNNYGVQLKATKDGDMRDRMLVEQNGVFAYLSDLCGQYNARSKMLNRTLFKDKNLPFTMSITLTQDGRAVLMEGN